MSIIEKGIEAELRKKWKPITEFLIKGYQNMNIQEAYEVMQAAWVELYNVEVGDVVRLLRAPKISNELGCFSYKSTTKERYVGYSYEIEQIYSTCLVLKGCLPGHHCFPFFCLEFVKKAEPVIEITCKVNGEVTTLKTLSEETLLNIRENS